MSESRTTGDAHRPLLAGLSAELSSLRGDVTEMLALRWQLARLEVESDVRLVRRLFVVVVAAVVMVLTALPLWCAAAAEWLDGCWGVGRAGWLAIFGALLVGLAAAAAGIAWRRFRTRLVGLQESLEELREDAVWIREWLGDPAGDDLAALQRRV